MIWVTLYLAITFGPIAAMLLTGLLHARHKGAGHRQAEGARGGGEGHGGIHTLEITDVI